MQWLGVFGFILAAAAYVRIDKLEKRLKELQVLDQDFKSE